MPRSNNMYKKDPSVNLTWQISQDLVLITSRSNLNIQFSPNYSITFMVSKIKPIRLHYCYIPLKKTTPNDILIISDDYKWKSNYHQTSNTRHSISKQLNVSCLILQLSLPNPLKTSVKSRMKMQLMQHRQAMLRLTKINTLGPSQNFSHFIKNIVKYIFLNGNVWILLNI